LFKVTLAHWPRAGNRFQGSSLVTLSKRRKPSDSILQDHLKSFRRIQFERNEGNWSLKPPLADLSAKESRQAFLQVGFIASFTLPDDKSVTAIRH